MVNHKLNQKPSSTISLSIAILILLGGCTPPSLMQVRTFGTASSSLAENSKKAFALLESSRVTRNMYDVAGNPKLCPTNDTFNGLFDSYNEPEKLKLRLGVLSKLGDYAQALEALSTADFRKDVDEASKELYGSLIGLKETYKKVSGKELPLDEKDIGLISTAVDAIGSVIVEAKRREAIKTIIINADDAVQDASKLIASEFGEASNIADFVKQNLTNADGSIRAAYNREKLLPKSDFRDRYKTLADIKIIYDAAKSSPSFFKELSGGAKKLGAAHAALKLAVNNDEFSSPEIGMQIGELVKFSKSVKSYYESLQSTAKGDKQ